MNEDRRNEDGEKASAYFSQEEDLVFHDLQIAIASHEIPQPTIAISRHSQSAAAGHRPIPS